MRQRKGLKGREGQNVMVNTYGRMAGREEDRGIKKNETEPCLKMGSREQGGKGPGLTQVILHIPADSQGETAQ